jgi:DNA-directed RNA polymerase specialized sigma24 family protein
MTESLNRESAEQRESLFVTTRWSIVAAAAGPNSAIACEALEKLCADYWRPVFCFILRAGKNVEDARDLTQMFFADLLESRAYARATPDRGRFRFYLLGTLKHFLADAHDRAKTRKRGGHLEFLRFDTVMGDTNPSPCASPELQFDRQWALSTLECGLARLREEYQLSGRTAFFDALKDFLTQDNSCPYSGAALRLGISEGAAKMSVTRMRQRLRAIIRQEIAQTVGSLDQVESEFHAFFSALTS